MLSPEKAFDHLLETFDKHGGYGGICAKTDSGVTVEIKIQSTNEAERDHEALLVELSRLSEELADVKEKLEFETAENDFGCGGVRSSLRFAVARAEAAEKELYALKEELAEVSQKWLNKEAECNELLLIKVQRDEQREFIEKIGDAVFKSAEVGNAKVESIEKELAETKAQASRLREAVEQIDQSLCSISSQSVVSDKVLEAFHIINSVLAETPAKSLARIQAQAIRRAVVSIGTKKRYTANEVVAIMRDKADRLEQEADGR